MDDTTLLMIESLSDQIETPIGKDENLRNRVGTLVEELRRQGVRVDAVTDAHPWYLRVNNAHPGFHDPSLFALCDEVARTLQIELARAPDRHG